MARHRSCAVVCKARNSPDTAVLINEFGEIGLDHELVEASEEDTVVLKGGCICCTIREDLASTIRHLADLRRTGKIKPFSRLVVETSGLADPVPVLVTLKSDPRITQHLEFKGTIVTVDGVLVTGHCVSTSSQFAR